MYKQIRPAAAVTLLIFAITCSALGAPVPHGDSPPPTKTVADDASLDKDSFATLRSLYAAQPKAKLIGDKSKAILVFPRILKAGLVVGGLSGHGELIEQGKVVGTYNISAASLGLQAGAQSFSQVMFFANDSALEYLNKTSGWSVGVGPSVVVVDSGVATSMGTDTLSSDVYIFIFGQKGLMGGLGVQGQKITQLAN